MRQDVWAKADWAQVWVEEKEDYRFDEYGNRIPDRYLQPQYASVPRPYRSRM